VSVLPERHRLLLDHIAISGGMSICHPAGPAGRTAHAVEFTIGEQIEIHGHHGATKFELQGLIEVKLNFRIQVKLSSSGPALGPVY
jgi:hypothetical protein